MAIDSLTYFRFIKAYNSSLFSEVLLYLSSGQTRSIPNIFLLYSYSFLSSYPESTTIYKAEGKENKDECDVKEIYILLSGTFAVVTSAVRGTIIFPVAHVRGSLYPNIHFLV